MNYTVVYPHIGGKVVSRAFTDPDKAQAFAEARGGTVLEGSANDQYARHLISAKKTRKKREVVEIAGQSFELREVYVVADKEVRVRGKKNVVDVARVEVEVERCFVLSPLLKR